MKKILCLLLTLVMIIGILPCEILAATELSFDGGTITLKSDTKIGSVPLTTLNIYKQGNTSDYPEIVSVTQDGSTINITLAEGTNLSYPLQMGFSGSSGYFQNSGNTCTLKNGRGTAKVTVQAKPAPVPNAQPLGEGTFTVNFSVKMGVVYNVIIPDGEGFEFAGEATVGKNQDYSFKVNIDKGYDGTFMVVRVNGNEISANNGVYTVTDVRESLVITIEGIEAKSIYTVTLKEGSSYTITGQDTSYAGEPYTFTVHFRVRIFCKKDMIYCEWYSFFDGVIFLINQK